MMTKQRTKMLAALIAVLGIATILTVAVVQRPQKIQPKAVGENVGELYIDPQTLTPAVDVNGQVVFQVKANVGPSQLNLFRLRLTYEPSKLQINADGCSAGLGFQKLDFVQPLCVVDSTAGTITTNFLQATQLEGPTGQAILLQVTGTALARGQTTVGFNAYELTVKDMSGTPPVGDSRQFTVTSAIPATYIIGSAAATATLPPATATVTQPPATITAPPATATVSAPPTTQPPTPQQGNVIINFRLKFQGVAAKRDDKTVAFTLVGGPGNIRRDFPNVPIVSDAGGSWFGSITTDVPLGDGYLVLVKGPMHLKRKYCDADPTPVSESADYHCGSQGQIRLVAGVNQLDFRRTIIYIGDLPPQDGEMNARDASELRLNLTKTDADALSRADVNFDGIVNTTDWSLIIESMQVNFDEEI